MALIGPGLGKQVLITVLGLGFLVLVLPRGARTQDSSAAAPQRQLPYLIPQTVFVGDPGRLVVPLGPVWEDFQPLIREQAETEPWASPDLVIQRIELENHGGTVRLLIDLVAYTTGLVALPDLAIPELQSQGISTLGLQVPIASILNRDGLVLSGPLPPPSIPGTGILIYGTAVGLFLLILTGIGFRLWGRDRLKVLQERFSRRRLIRSLQRIIDDLGKDLGDAASGHHEQELLNRLSGEFRRFLSLFTGIPCHTLTAGEFSALPPLIPSPQVPESGEAKPPGNDRVLLSGFFLCGFFRRCDTLRFSGTCISPGELLGILNELQRFTHTLDQADRERNRLIGRSPLKRKGAA